MLWICHLGACAWWHRCILQAQSALWNVSTSPFSETPPGAWLPWRQEPPGVEGMLPSLSVFSKPLHFSPFSSFSLHFNSVASQRFLFQAAEHCISLTPLHTWFNFQLAWDAREIIWLLRLVGVLDVPSFPPVPPAPAKLFRVGCQADTRVCTHPLPSLVLFYAICSELEVWAARRNHLEISAPASAASCEVGSGLSGARGSLSGGGFKNCWVLVKAVM